MNACRWLIVTTFLSLACPLSCLCCTLKTTVGLRKWLRRGLPIPEIGEEAKDAIDIASSSARSSSLLNYQRFKKNPFQYLGFSYQSGRLQHTGTMPETPAPRPPKGVPRIQPTFDPATRQLEPTQLEELALWRMTPGISTFIDKLELAVTDLVKKLTNVESSLLGPREFRRLIETFSEGEETPSENILESMHRFIEEVYQCRLNSNFPRFLANVYRRNEYEIYKNYGKDCLQMESYRIKTLNYVERLNAKASEYYGKATFDVDAWEERIALILDGFNWVYNNLEKQPLSVWLNQSRARCGDENLFHFLEESARKNLPVNKIRHFLLESTKGMDSTRREDLLCHTENIYNDMWGFQGDENSEQQTGHLENKKETGI